MRRGRRSGAKPVNEVLVSFVGMRDPYSTDRNGMEQDGPILTLLSQRPFPRVALIHDFTEREIQGRLVSMPKKALDTKDRIRERFPGCEVEIYPYRGSVVGHAELWNRLSEVLNLEQERSPEAKLWGAAASGSPAMHAAMLLVAASGVPPFRLLYQHDPEQTKGNQPLIEELMFFRGAAWRIVPPWALSKTPDEVDLGELRPETVTFLEKNFQVAEDKWTRAQMKRAELCARGRGSVLILGETGTGKEFLAKMIHDLSPRAGKPYERVNCSTLEPSMADNILFGHEPGAYTGARPRGHSGLFEACDGGTVFLDEIGTLPEGTQGKLLRFLDDGGVRRMTNLRERRVDVRIVAATNEAIADRPGFRQDLIHRLAGYCLHTRPLRDRTDFAAVAQAVWRSLQDRPDLKAGRPERLDEETVAWLSRQEWPGNIRQLKAVLESAQTYAQESSFRLELVSMAYKEQVSTTRKKAKSETVIKEVPEGFQLRQHLEEEEARWVTLALRQTGNAVTKAATLVGLPASTFSDLVRKHGIPTSKTRARRGTRQGD